ncbi:MAG TPA: hypothetical protein VHL53_11375 [Acidimicrobiia bacterium]|nr:hypothetical protein [Acidimicrobiia bacterium]
MLPWKLFARFLSALILFATGGFAAGHDLPLPFTNPPAATAPAPVETTTTTTAPPAVDDTTTTTTAPSDSQAVDITDVTGDGPSAGTPAVPVETPPAKPPTTTTTAPPAVVPDPADAPTPPAPPVDGDAPPVCAAAATAVCGPVEPAPTADDSHAARVQRCQDWWNSLAEAFDHNNRPEWATRARQIADRCDAMITGWEQLEQRWEAHHPKGDHNHDGHPDNGRGHDGDHPAPPARPRPQPPAKQVSRHGEGRH